MELSVYPATGPNPIIKRIFGEDPRAITNGWMDVRYDNGPVRTIYTGKTLPTGKYVGCFKVGTYAGYNGGYNSEVWAHMIEVIGNGAPANIPSMVIAFKISEFLMMMTVSITNIQSSDYFSFL
ncbi:unnamed protein product [Rotaria magnacalcarata]|uniref:Uncharacterized protein n=2 Tax=Rotaria magnacalcarata TaxID=392030 RepID=A0A818XLX2_9BILA|nr:unnamed protein product [Rotaria magnacalcarata]CAF3738636.1 unnamed protein product [Rotaria magnacalcarata]CAF3855155.1 unnamed protein product [Rotaria magnacalcarata]